MLLIDYVLDNGMNEEDYDNLKANIKSIALATVENIKVMHPKQTGMYYPISEIINHMADKNIKYFIIQELKKLHVEFIEDYTLYRY